ncbi:uncharacterized protein BO97DRAFT_409875 [Aspergillus homomorphus CBS 101889]|uniref:Uncharacterized protein n=1 Tax=Aspergillus homomorphus (strain CBS 101889) TaxID=1450537 RepID=A0A395IGW7_ASPHC|nr:hypothetical protein BO97DRAFT_409875 [Aspergillus homomorphus CBS 101889]RAL17444.1 hypothetical protein BO97DRAFT_409875 [Aspergillus homomorphus CBS 101889]
MPTKEQHPQPSKTKKILSKIMRRPPEIHNLTPYALLELDRRQRRAPEHPSGTATPATRLYKHLSPAQRDQLRLIAHAGGYDLSDLRGYPIPEGLPTSSAHAAASPYHENQPTDPAIHPQRPQHPHHLHRPHPRSSFRARNRSSNDFESRRLRHHTRNTNCLRRRVLVQEAKRGSIERYGMVAAPFWRRRRRRWWDGRLESQAEADARRLRALEAEEMKRRLPSQSQGLGWGVRRFRIPRIQSLAILLTKTRTNPDCAALPSKPIVNKIQRPAEPVNIPLSLPASRDIRIESLLRPVLDLPNLQRILVELPLPPNAPQHPGGPIQPRALLVLPVLVSQKLKELGIEHLVGRFKAVAIRREDPDHDMLRAWGLPWRHPHLHLRSELDLVFQKE